MEDVDEREMMEGGQKTEELGEVSALVVAMLGPDETAMLKITSARAQLLMVHTSEVDPDGHLSPSLDLDIMMTVITRRAAARLGRANEQSLSSVFSVALLSKSTIKIT